MTKNRTFQFHGGLNPKPIQPWALNIYLTLTPDLSPLNPKHQTQNPESKTWNPKHDLQPCHYTADDEEQPYEVLGAEYVSEDHDAD